MPEQVARADSLTTMSQQAGWYDDPEDEQNLRYWDGVQWTHHTAPKQKPDLAQSGQQWQAPESGEAGQAGQGQQGQGGYGQGQQGWGQQGQGGYGQGQQGWGQQGQGGYGQGQQGWGQQGQGGYGQGQQGWGQQPNPYAGQTGQNPYQGQWQGGPVPGGYQPQPGPTTPDGQPLAGWWHRVGARLLDGLLALVVSTVLVVATMSPEVRGAMEDYVMDPDPTGAMPVVLEDWILQLGLVTAVLGLAYEILMVKFFGGTVGKLITGLRVRLRDEPGLPSWRAVLLRSAVYQGPNLLGSLSPALSFLGLFTIINVLWPLWDANNQALHDKAAGTNVVKRR